MKTYTFDNTDTPGSAGMTLKMRNKKNSYQLEWLASEVEIVDFFLDMMKVVFVLSFLLFLAFVPDPSEAGPIDIIKSVSTDVDKNFCSTGK